MKKLLSLLLVLCLVVALAPAAYAADAKEYVEVPGVGKTRWKSRTGIRHMKKTKETC